MQPTMADVWDQLSADDKQIILRFTDDGARLELLALTRIEKVMTWMCDTKQRDENGKLKFPLLCTCNLCTKIGKRAAEIFEILESATRNGA